jgi:hypothetical protein
MNTDEIINEGYGEGRNPRMDVMYTFSGKVVVLKFHFL